MTHPAPSHWWERRWRRLPVLLILLAAAAVYGVPTILHNASARGGQSCPTAPTTLRLPDSRFRPILQASGVEGLIGGGTPDTQGWQEPGAAWSDASPSNLVVSSSTRVDAGYELRWWSAVREHEAATFFVFATAVAADRYVSEASSVRCHQSGVAFPVERPPRARGLVWINPDQARQADVFFARGTRVYRIAVVPSQSGRGGRGVLAVAQRLACQLRDAVCPRG